MSKINKIINIFIEPRCFFFLANFFPLLLWVLIDENWFEIALQGYKKSELTIFSGLAWFLYFFSFWFGSKLVKNCKEISSKFIHPLMQKLHMISALLTLFATIVIVYFFRMEGLDAFFLLLSSNANELKIALYSSDIAYQLAIMSRHLIISVFITWPFLINSYVKKFSLVILIIEALILTIFTSSRLTAISMVIIWLLQRDYGSRTSNQLIFSKKIFISVMVMLILFGAGVASRSLGTWSNLTGSDSVFTNATAEFLAYYISPINYSVAIVNNVITPDSDLAMMFVLGFIYSLFNVDTTSFMNELMLSIDAYYNPSLNQIGLMGQFFSGYHILFFIPIMAYGYICQKLYYSYLNNEVYGILLYPIVYISLFDSFRGFLLTQNILMANIIFILSMLTLAPVISKKFKLVVQGKARLGNEKQLSKS